ncbi:MAG: hypothetical protein ACRC7O_08320, partial [Fimbriiglobus sp.]
AGPEDAFRRGVELRADAATARPYFAEAAVGFAPDDAVNRGRAYFLAGNVPAAVLAFRNALETTPWDAAVQRNLAAVRAAVPYPTESAPAERVRPDPPTGLRHRVSPADLLTLAVAASVVIGVGLAARFTARPGWATPVAVVGGIGVIAVSLAAGQIHREAARDRAEPVAVVFADTMLRTGNATAFPARVAAPLPAGTEVRVCGDRGGWVRVRLPGGATGWLPEPVLERNR